MRRYMLFHMQGSETTVEVRLANKSLWLTADQMAELFQLDSSTIQGHVKKIYEDRELNLDSTCALFAQVQTEGGNQWNKHIKYS